MTHDTWHMTHDTWHMTHDTWHMTNDTWHFYLLLHFFLYLCYYRHTSRDSVSPVCMILKSSYYRGQRVGRVWQACKQWAINGQSWIVQELDSEGFTIENIVSLLQGINSWSNMFCLELVYKEGVGSVMITNIQIFEYSNKMALKYYLYSYLCHFPSTNIFGYSFVDFWTTEYIQIFVCKFSKIRLYLNICSESYFNIQLSIFNEKSKSGHNLCIKNMQCKILFWGNIRECF